MSREPSSPMHRGWSAYDEPEPPPKKPRIRPGKRNFKVRVEPSKKQKQRALTKLTNTTEALTAEERKIVRGYRLSVGGSTAEAERRLLEGEIARTRKDR